MTCKDGHKNHRWQGFPKKCLRCGTVKAPESRSERLDLALMTLDTARDSWERAKSEIEDFIADIPDEDYEKEQELPATLIEAMDSVETSIDYSEIESLRDEMQSWQDSLSGTNLENSNKYEMITEALDMLDNAVGELESIDIDMEHGATKTKLEEFAERLDESINTLESAKGDLDGIVFPGMYD